MMRAMNNRSGKPGAAGGARCVETFARRFAELHRLAKRFLGSRRGNVMAIFAVAFTVIIGAVGLGTDAASWYSTKRDMQNAADLAAVGSAESVKRQLQSYLDAGATDVVLSALDRTDAAVAEELWAVAAEL